MVLLKVLVLMLMVLVLIVVFACLVFVFLFLLRNPFVTVGFCFAFRVGVALAYVLQTADSNMIGAS